MEMYIIILLYDFDDCRKSRSTTWMLVKMTKLKILGFNMIIINI